MPPRGRRPAGGSDTREAILTATGELFAEVGFERATMREVATRAGVDPALIHHYFTNKDGVLAAALALPVDPAALLAGLDKDPDHAGQAIVRRVLGVWESSSRSSPSQPRYITCCSPASRAASPNAAAPRRSRLAKSADSSEWTR